MTRALGRRRGCPQVRGSCLPPTQGRLHSASIERALGAVLAPRGPPHLPATGPPSACPGVLLVPFPGTLGESPAEEPVLGGDQSLEVTATHQAPIKTPTAAREEAPSPGTHQASPGSRGCPSRVCPGTGASGELPRAADQTDGHRRDRWVPELQSERTWAMPASAQMGSLLGTGRWMRGGTPEPPGTSLRSSQRLIRPQLHLPSTRGFPCLPRLQQQKKPGLWMPEGWLRS